jgi:hypothetical protein
LYLVFYDGAVSAKQVVQPQLKPTERDALNPILALFDESLCLLSAAHLLGDVVPWMQASMGALESVRVLPVPPAWCYRKMAPIKDQVMFKLNVEDLKCILEFHDVLAEVAVATVSIKTGAMEAGTSCTLLSKWIGICTRISDLHPVVLETMKMFNAAVEVVFTSVYEAALAKSKKFILESMIKVDSEDNPSADLVATVQAGYHTGFGINLFCVVQVCGFSFKKS